MPSQWDHKADKDLLLAIIDEGQLKSIIWPSIAGKMTAKGYTFTHEACRQHFQKLRKESRTTSSAATTPSSTPIKPTPKPRKTTNGAKILTPTTSKASSFSNTNSTQGDDDDEEEMLFNPSAKRRKGLNGSFSMGGNNGGGIHGGGNSVKNEFASENGGRTAMAFKMEGGGHIVHLDGENLYSEDA